MTPVRRRFPVLLSICAACLLALQACAPLVVEKAKPPVHADVPNAIRTLGADGRFSTLSAQTVAQRLHARRAGESVNILALSGGGAESAFGAGALVGLARAGTRPEYSVVTGVSAGALLAPYAFLGPAWDEQLVDIYTAGRAQHLLHSRGLGAFFGSSVYSGAPLRDLVDRYATDALVQAVAREAAGGRLLLVATTDVGTGEPVVWDLGSIALNGGTGARALFRDVLVASASVPGMFPPVVIHVQEQSALYDEVHIDGTIVVPFFVPLALAEPAKDMKDRPRDAAVYVIVDAQLSEQPLPIRMRAQAILTRSVSAGLDHLFRTTLELTATNAELQGARLQYTAISPIYPKLGPFDFNTETMRSLFRYGYECAKAGRLWVSSRNAGDDPTRKESSAGPDAPCPADDGPQGRFVSR